MKKKLLAAAVAGAFAVPAFAFAASSVTISGYFKVGIENAHMGSGTTNAKLGLAAPNRANNSETRLTDNSSRIDFNVKEDLGGGLSAIGLFDFRIDPRNGNGFGGAGGNDWVGLESNQWGRITLGRRDLHYYHTADTLPYGATALDGWSVALLSYVPTFNNNGGATPGQLAIANATRTNSVIEYSSPKWGMFEFGLAYSTDPYKTTNTVAGNNIGGDMNAVPNPCAGTCTTQKAYAWNFAPQLRGGNWVAGYSYYKSQAAYDPKAGTTAPDERSDRLWGYYIFPQGFRVGMTWDRSEYDMHANGPNGSSPDIKRNTWSLPVSYKWGPNQVGLTYTVAQNVSISNLPAGANPDTSNTGAKEDALYYEYSLSKRTSMGVTYAKISNDSNAAYNLFVNPVLGTTDSVAFAGEDPRIVQFDLMHAF